MDCLVDVALEKTLAGLFSKDLDESLEVAVVFSAVVDDFDEIAVIAAGESSHFLLVFDEFGVEFAEVGLNVAFVVGAFSGLGFEAVHDRLF